MKRLIAAMSNQWSASHFMSSLNGNPPGIREDFQSVHANGPHIFSTNPRGVAARPYRNEWDPSNLTKENIQWDKSTYVLPTVLPPTALPELRSRALALTLKPLKRSTRPNDMQ